MWNFTWYKKKNNYLSSVQILVWSSIKQAYIYDGSCSLENLTYAHNTKAKSPHRLESKPTNWVLYLFWIYLNLKYTLQKQIKVLLIETSLICYWTRNTCKEKRKRERWEQIFELFEKLRKHNYYYFWMLHVNRATYSEIAFVHQSICFVCPFVCPSAHLSVHLSVTKFSQDWIISFFLILYMIKADHNI